MSDDKHVWLQWRNDWGVDYLAHESWTGSADSRGQAVRFHPLVNFLTGKGSLECGRIVTRVRQREVHDHGRSSVARSEVPMIEWEVDGTKVIVDPSSVRIQAASLVQLPLPQEGDS